MRVFYGLWPNNPKQQSWLNILRFLADPGQKTIAHLTVRGPYKQRYQLKSATSLIKGRTLHITGADSFRSPTQSTAILKCANDDILRKIWHKPDYPGFTPHITICDGLDHEYTQKVMNTCANIRPFSFQVNTLEPIITKPLQAHLSLSNSVDLELLSTIIRSHAAIDTIKNTNQETRLFWLDLAVRSQP